MRTRQTVRSFLFSVRIDAPLARLHVVTKLLAILALSSAAVHALRTEDPDPIAAISLVALALLGLSLSGAIRWLFRSYLVVILPALVGMVLAWIVFNPAEEAEALLHVAFHPLTIAVSKANVTLAVTKGLGYGAMILTSLMLVMTTRDVEIVGAMRQLKVPYVACFFVSIMLRSLSMALTDYTTIRQAQIARGATLKKRGVFGLLSDLAYMAVPLTVTTLRRSREVGDAALVRGFSMETSNPTEFHEIQPFGMADGIVSALCILLVVSAYALRLNLTRLLGATW